MDPHQSDNEQHDNNDHHGNNDHNDSNDNRLPEENQGQIEGDVPMDSPPEQEVEQTEVPEQVAE